MTSLEQEAKDRNDVGVANVLEISVEHFGFMSHQHSIGRGKPQVPFCALSQAQKAPEQNQQHSIS
jgi:hypothetical protein